MTIELPRDIENSIIAKVHSGLFPSMDAAMTEAARLLLERIERDQMPVASPDAATTQPTGQMHGSIGAMRQDAEFLDEVVAGAMKARQVPALEGGQRPDAAAAVAAMIAFQEQEAPTLGGTISIRDLINEGRR